MSRLKLKNPLQGPSATSLTNSLGRVASIKPFAIIAPKGFGKDVQGAYANPATAPTPYVVKSLRDSGAYSLREAIEATGSRTVTFAAELDGKQIQTQSTLEIASGNISINGAANDAIPHIVHQTNSAAVIVKADQVILQNLSIAIDFLQLDYDPNDCIQVGADSVAPDNVYLKNCTVAGHGDEGISVYRLGSLSSENITIEKCCVTIPTEPRLDSDFGGIDSDAYGVLFTNPDLVTLYQTWIGHIFVRGPRFVADSLADTGADYTLRCEVINSMNHNCANNVTLGTKGSVSLEVQAAIINCYFATGPNTRVSTGVIDTNDNSIEGTQTYYADGNLHPGLSLIAPSANGLTESLTLPFTSSGASAIPAADVPATLATVVGPRRSDGTTCPVTDNAIDSYQSGWDASRWHGYAASYLSPATLGVSFTVGDGTEVHIPDLGLTDKLRVTCRVKVPEDQADVGRILNQWEYDSGDNRTFELQIRPTGEVRFVLAESDGIASDFWTGDSQINDGDWHTLDLTVRDPGEAGGDIELDSLLVDGVADSITADGGNTGITSFNSKGAETHFGRTNAGVVDDADIIISDVNIYVDDVLTRVYTFDGDTKDSSGNGQDATEVGTIGYHIVDTGPEVTPYYEWDFDSSLAFDDGTDWECINATSGHNHIDTENSGVGGLVLGSIGDKRALQIDDDGTDQSARIDSVIGLNDFTAHVVVNFNAFPANGILLGQTSNSSHYISVQADTQFRIELDGRNDINVSALPTDTTMVLSFVRDGTTFEIYRDGASIGTDASVAATQFDFSRIGGRGTTTQNPDCNIGAVRIYQEAQTAGEVSTVATAMLADWTPAPIPPDPGDAYLRPGGVETYLRPGGVETYLRA